MPAPTERTSVKRLPDRGVYDREAVNAILDEALLCHVGFPLRGSVGVIPTGFVRIDDEIILHGSSASMMLRTLARGEEACIAVTILDGLILARSAFHHSMNYRSVVVFGKGRVLEGAEKRDATDRFVEKMVPQRLDEIRPPSEKELRATSVIAVPINEASAKVRTGPPLDDETDYSLPVWAGEIPMKLVTLEPIPDPRMDENTPVPDHVKAFSVPSGIRGETN